MVRSDAPWSLRPARATRGRAALEIHEDDSLLDVTVASSLAPLTLRGARSASVSGSCHTLAWGCLPEPGADLVVTFSRGWLRQRTRSGNVVVIDGWFWFAHVAERFDRVAVTRRGIDGGWSVRVTRAG